MALGLGLCRLLNSAVEAGGTQPFGQAASKALLVGPCLHLQGWGGLTVGRMGQTGTEKEEPPGFCEINMCLKQFRMQQRM